MHPRSGYIPVALLVTLMMLFSGAAAGGMAFTGDSGTEEQYIEKNTGEGGSTPASPMNIPLPTGFSSGPRRVTGEPMWEPAMQMLSGMVGPAVVGATGGASSRANDDPGNDDSTGATEVFDGLVEGTSRPEQAFVVALTDEQPAEQ